MVTRPAQTVQAFGVASRMSAQADSVLKRPSRAEIAQETGRVFLDLRWAAQPVLIRLAKRAAAP